ncbi:MAG: histidine kinase [Flavobacteriaceae bacterium]|nr:histidine kinase [Flavobacteriaceae bacterium]
MQQQNLDNVFNIILNSKYRWFYHLIFWLIVFSVDLTTVNAFSKNIYDLEFTIIILLLEMIIVYFNIYFLFSKFLVKGKIYQYIFYTILSIIIYIYLNHLFFYQESVIETLDPDNNQKYTTTTIISLMAFSFRMFSIIGTAVGIKFFKRYFIEQKQIHTIKQDSLENELRYLKNQINPHFLFNSLNNIYVLSKKNISTTSDSILLLSDLLRYQLYDCTKKHVSLDNEIGYLRNFLKLEELRKKNSEIILSITGDTFQVQISPFIFMPFIENAIKYSGLTEQPKIDIQFNITETQIHFLVSNNKTDATSTNKDGGIGLSNVKRRLFLLYENAHELQIKESNNTYNVNLILNKN